VPRAVVFFLFVQIVVFECWQVRVLTYNVLSSSLCEADYHVKCNAQDLDERTRLRRVCDLLAPEVASGTIICLQEKNICLCICMYIHTYMCVYIYIYIYTWHITYTHTHYIYIYIHICICMCMYMYSIYI
jgi:hypothetical protein